MTVNQVASASSAQPRAAQLHRQTAALFKVYLTRFSLIVASQAAMVTACLLAFIFDKLFWLEPTFAVAGLAVPFLCYVVVAFKSPFMARWRLLRVLVMVLISAPTSIGGFTLLYFFGQWLIGFDYFTV